MMTPTDANPNYAKGWEAGQNYNPFRTIGGTGRPSRDHDGDRSHAFTVLLGDLHQHSVPDPDLDDLDGLPWNMARQVKSWQPFLPPRPLSIQTGTARVPTRDFRRERQNARRAGDEDAIAAGHEPFVGASKEACASVREMHP